MAVQVTEQEVVGLPEGLAATDHVRYMIIQTDSSLVQSVRVAEGELLDVLLDAAKFIPAQEEWEIEEDGERDLSTPAAVLNAIDVRLDCGSDPDPVITIVDLATGQLIYKAYS